MIEKGMFFTPDKKKLLTDEVQSELNKLTEDIRNKGLGSSSANKLQQIKKKLQEIINLLNGKKGVITPPSTLLFKGVCFSIFSNKSKLNISISKPSG